MLFILRTLLSTALVLYKYIIQPEQKNKNKNAAFHFPMPPAMSKHLGLWALWLGSTWLRWSINTFKAVIKKYITAPLMPWKFIEDSQIFPALIKQNNKSNFFRVSFYRFVSRCVRCSLLPREVKRYGSQSDAVARHTFKLSFIWDAGSIVCMNHHWRALPFWQESVFQPEFQLFLLFGLFWSSSLCLPPWWKWLKFAKVSAEWSEEMRTWPQNLFRGIKQWDV